MSELRQGRSNIYQLQVGALAELHDWVAQHEPFWRGALRRLGHPLAVTWTLTEQDGGTLLRLTHTGFAGLRPDLVSFILGSGWWRMLTCVALAAELGVGR